MTKNQYLLKSFLTYNSKLNFSTGIRTARNQVKKERISWVFNQANQGISIDAILKTLKVA